MLTTLEKMLTIPGNDSCEHFLGVNILDSCEHFPGVNILDSCEIMQAFASVVKL